MLHAKQASKRKPRGKAVPMLGAAGFVVVAGERSIRSNQWVGGGYADAEHRSKSPNHSL